MARLVQFGPVAVCSAALGAANARLRPREVAFDVRPEPAPRWPADDFCGGYDFCGPVAAEVRAVATLRPGRGRRRHPGAAQHKRRIANA
jgi:hypothetical protein